MTATPCATPSPRPNSSISKSGTSARARSRHWRGSSGTSKKNQSSTSTRRWCSRRDAPDQRAEDLVVSLQPRLEREAFDRAPAGCSRIALTVGEHARDRIRESPRRRGLVTLPTRRMRQADARLVADELNGAPACGIDDGQPTGHGLEHGGRTRVEHLRVEQDIGPSIERGLVALRVPAYELDPLGDAELAHELLRIGEETTRHNQARIGEQ